MILERAPEMNNKHDIEWHSDLKDWTTQEACHKPNPVQTPPVMTNMSYAIWCYGNKPREPVLSKHQDLDTDHDICLALRSLSIARRPKRDGSRRTGDTRSNTGAATTLRQGNRSLMR